jgi:hypothetical protein
MSKAAPGFRLITESKRHSYHVELAMPDDLGTVFYTVPPRFFKRLIDEMKLLELDGWKPEEQP